MFHLLKLAIYGLIGYAIYEFAQGIMEDTAHRQGNATDQSHPRRTAVRSGARR